MTGQMTSDGEEEEEGGLLPVGCSVIVVARPEQWLRGRVGRVHSWDGGIGRYMVLVELEGADGPQPVMLRSKHLERAEEAGA